MAQPPRRVQFAQIAYLVVFGAFVAMSLYRLTNGTATKLTWLSLGIAAVLFVGTAYRMIRDLSKHDA